MIFTPFILITLALSSILSIRNLSPAIYEDYATLMSFLSFFVLFSKFGCNIGFARFLNETKNLNARHTFYTKLQIRRWVIAFIFALVLILISPYWAIKIKLLNSDWTPSTLFLIGLLGEFMLHTQLASSAKLNSCNHGYVSTNSQAEMFARALTLVILAISIKQPIIIQMVLIPIALAEAVFLQ